MSMLPIDDIPIFQKTSKSALAGEVVNVAMPLAA